MNQPKRKQKRSGTFNGLELAELLYGHDDRPPNFRNEQAGRKARRSLFDKPALHRSSRKAPKQVRPNARQREEHLTAFRTGRAMAEARPLLIFDYIGGLLSIHVERLRRGGFVDE